MQLDGQAAHFKHLLAALCERADNYGVSRLQEGIPTNV
jgi:hypothetical protein